MKFIWTSLLLVSLIVSLEAGKVTWGDDGSATIAGIPDEGCTESGFGTEDKNTTDADCS